MIRCNLKAESPSKVIAAIRFWAEINVCNCVIFHSAVRRKAVYRNTFDDHALASGWQWPTPRFAESSEFGKNIFGSISPVSENDILRARTRRTGWAQTQARNSSCWKSDLAFGLIDWQICPAITGTEIPGGDHYSPEHFRRRASGPIGNSPHQKTYKTVHSKILRQGTTWNNRNWLAGACVPVNPDVE
jgi:hypothetical protein